MVTKTVAPIEDTGAPPPEDRDVKPPPPPPEDRDVEAPRVTEKRRAAEKRRKARARDIGEVPPPPITEKFPGEVPPYPAGYTPPEGRVAESDAKGRPTVIVTSAGLRQYTPNSTMFKMGYLNSDQYLKSGVARGDKTVDATAFLPLTSEEGTPLLIDKDVAFKLREKRPKQQFEAMQEMGIISHNSKFVRGSGGRWSYIPTREVSRVKVARQQKIRATKRIIEFKKTNIKLPDGTWLAKEDWATIPANYQSIALKKGYNAMINAIDQGNKEVRTWVSKRIIIGDQAMPLAEWNALPSNYQSIAIQQNSFNAMVKAVEAHEVAQNKAIATMEKYKTEKGYNLLVAAHEGVDSKTMELAGFSPKAIKWADESL